MSINLSWRGTINGKHVLYAALDDFDKKFLLPNDLMFGTHVPGLLILSKIRGISIELIPHIIDRVQLIESPAYIEQIDKWLSNNHKPALPEYLVRFTGVTSNLDNMSTKDFGKFLASRLPNITRSQIDYYLRANS